MKNLKHLTYTVLLVTQLFISVNAIAIPNISQTTVKSEEGNSKINSYSSNPSDSLIMITGMPQEKFVPTFHPMIDDYSILSLTFDSLVEVHPVSGEIIPSLAKQWVVTNDSKHWTFYLYENITCHDASPINASAIKAVFDMILDQNNPGYNSNGLPMIKSMPLESVEILSEFIIRINFKTSFSSFISLQAAAIRIPSLTSYPDINLIYQDRFPQTDGYWPIGSGPYKLQNITNQGEYFDYSFIYYDNYFRGTPPFKTVNYHLYFSFEDAAKAVINKKGQTGPYYPHPHIMKESEVDFEYWSKFPQCTASFVALLNHRKSELANREVRLALNYAISKQEFIDMGNEDNLFEYSHSQTLIPDEDTPKGKQAEFPYNPELANKMLDKAGYPRQSDGYRFRLYINGHSWVHEEILFLVKYLEDVGIRCQYTLNNSNWFEDFHGGSFHIYVGSWGYYDWMYDAYTLLNSNGFPGKISDEELDKYTGIGYTTPVVQEKNFPKRKTIERVADFVPHILLADFNHYGLRQKSVENFVWFGALPLGGIFFNYTTINPNPPSKIENVEIKNQSLYFPFTDGIITSLDEINATMELSKNAQAFIHNNSQNGKFFKISVGKEIDYSVRCYYDLDEIEKEDYEEMMVFRWEDQEEDWTKVDIESKNQLQQYLEVTVRGDTILKLGKELTFKFLPGVTVVAGILVTIAVITIFYNKKFINFFKDEYDL
jgi:peptide/nickel transport system substrate-binding protein